MAETKEFKLNGAAEIEKVVSEIKDNFASENENPVAIIVRFEEGISEEELLTCLSALWNFEIECEHIIDILIKNLSYEKRRAAMKLALQTPKLKNTIFLTNVFCLVKGYNTFDDSYFEHEQVFVNDEVEYLDILDDLEEEILEVIKNAAEYYVSMLKTCNMTDGIDNNPNLVVLDDLYVFLFSAADVMVLAKWLSLVKDTSVWETKKIVKNSLYYLGSVAEKFVFTNSILSAIDTALFEKSIKEAIQDK